MAKFTIERWKCDRCGCIEDKWSRPVPHIEVSICEDYDVGPGDRLIWKEICSDCTRVVREEFKEMMLSAKRDRAHIESKRPAPGGAA